MTEELTTTNLAPTEIIGVPQTLGGDALQEVTSPAPGELTISPQNPSDMVQHQHSLISWAENRILRLIKDYEELNAAYEHAKKSKWKTDTLKRHRDLCMDRIEYYKKMLEAFKEGYVLVPNFPLSLFAVRTEKEYPKQITSFYRSEQKLNNEDAQALKIGEGDYVNPVKNVFQQKVPDPDYPGNTKTKYSSGGYGSEFKDIEFPMNMAKPHIMEATSHAMALKIFDRIGVLPDPHPKKDPLICGQMIDPRPTGYQPKRFVTFIIGWHLDTRVL